MQIYTFSSEEKFWDLIESKIKKISPQNICASGGSSAKIFDTHAGKEFFTGDERVFIADERFVPEDHKDSNAKLLREKFSGKILSWHPNKFSTPEQCAEKYEEFLPFEFDLTVLGVGPDGHTASLFPHIPELDEREKKCVATKTTQFIIEDRISLTFRALQKSKNIFIIMIGSEKREILEKITTRKTSYYDFPARKIIDFENVEIFFLDT